MSSLIVQDAPLLEKCHHTFHEINTINELYHSSEIFQIIVGSTRLKRTRRVWVWVWYGKQDFVTVDQLGEMHIHIW